MRSPVSLNNPSPSKAKGSVRLRGSLRLKAELGGIQKSLKRTVQQRSAVIVTYGPHLKPIFLTTPLRYYANAQLDKNILALQNRQRTIIYQ